MGSGFSGFIYPLGEPPAGVKKARLSGLSSVFPLCRRKGEKEGRII